MHTDHIHPTIVYHSLTLTARFTHPVLCACVCVSVCVQDLFCCLSLLPFRLKAEADTKRLSSLKLGQREQHLLKSRELRIRIVDVEQGHDRLHQSCCGDRQASLNKDQAVSRFLPGEEWLREGH